MKISLLVLAVMAVSLRSAHAAADQSAIKCVSEWRFEPGMKAGSPVNIRAHVEVNFRLLGMSFDQKAEERRTRFNAIAARLQKDRTASQPTGTSRICKNSRRISCRQPSLSLEVGK